LQTTNANFTGRQVQCVVGSDALGLVGYDNVNYGDILFTGEFNTVNCVTILYKRLEMPNKFKEAASEISKGFSKFTSLIKKDSTSTAEAAATEKSEPVLVYDVLILKIEEQSQASSSVAMDGSGENAEALAVEVTNGGFYKRLQDSRRSYQVAVDTQSTQSSNGVFHS